MPGHLTQVIWLFYPVFGPSVNPSKENFETQTGAQYLINKTFGGTAGQHLWTIVDPLINRTFGGTAGQHLLTIVDPC